MYIYLYIYIYVLYVKREIRIWQSGVDNRLVYSMVAEENVCVGPILKANKERNATKEVLEFFFNLKF